MTDQRRTKVAILGGGVGGMTAAFELTATPELREQYEVTLHQLGWRLGGKGASGRNAAMGQRIEEHGLHVWFGFYANAMDLMRRCYDELDRPVGSPLATFEEAFTPCDEIVLGEEFDESWLLHTYNVPRNPIEPGTEGVLPTLWDLAARALEWAIPEWGSLVDDLDDPVDDPAPTRGWRDLVHRAFDAVEDHLEDFEARVHSDLLDVARRICRDLLSRPGVLGRHRRELLARVLAEFRDAIWDHAVADHMDHPGMRNFGMNVDLMVTMLVGILDDDLLGNGFDSIDDEELREWLIRHGLQPYTAVNSPVMRGWYSGGFAFEGGDVTKPNVAAGTAIHAVLRIFTYEDSVLRKMQAGMGDTVFTPMYQVLMARGVTFEFFHRVTGLRLSDDASRVAAIELVSQAEVLAGAYDPLVAVKGLDCWPSEPDWEQLKDGARLREAGIEFEYGQDAPDAKAVRLEEGTDFDEVVLAIPVGALASLCGELMAAHRPFADMVTHTATTRTQAFQLWVNETAEALGWKSLEDSILTAYVEPIDTYADMTHLLGRETWDPALDVRNIAYFCGVLPDDAGATQEQATEQAYAGALDFLTSDMGVVWGSADGGGKEPFDFDVLVDASGAVGAARLRSQYWRANIQPTERYTLSLAGTMKYRLAADESGFANLVLAGDWIRNGIDAGCVEATVMSGMQASRAICGVPKVVIGEHRDWLEGGSR